MDSRTVPNQSQMVEYAYASQHAEALALLSEIERKLMDMPAPDSDTPINWGHVGSVAEVRNKLEMLLGFLG